MALRGHGWCEESSGALAVGEPLEAAVLGRGEGWFDALRCGCLPRPFVDETRYLLVYNVTDEVEEDTTDALRDQFVVDGTQYLLVYIFTEEMNTEGENETRV